MTKKYLLGTILSIFFIISPAYAGSWNGWVYQNPYPTSNTLLAVKFVTPQKGWIVGEKGTILYTEDGGENWEAQESGTEQDIKSITFVNEKTGWAVGNGGVIIHTEDGGKTWVSQEGSDTVALNKVFFVSEKEGWVGGANGTFLHTNNGGETWNKEDIKAWADIAGIFFINPSAGWVLSGGRVFRTRDSGKNWDSSELPSINLPKRRFERPAYHGWQGNVFFTDDKRGWATVGLWYVFSTEDGGKTWQAKEVSNTVNSISFTDEKNGCMASTSILCTEDGGKTWKERLGVKPGEQVAEGRIVSLWGISFANQSIGWVVGKDGQIWKTEDGGRSWKVKSRGYSNAYFVDSKTGWNIQYDKFNKASIVKTEDGGNTWKVQKVFDTNVDINFFFINPRIGWAFGQAVGRDSGGDFISSRFILHTNDGGKTWVTQFKETPKGVADKDIFNRLSDVFFVNPDTGWMVGSRGQVMHTVDGGKHWEYQKSGVKMHLLSVKFIDVEKGWIIGADVNEGSGALVILHTDDSGKHWHIQWEKDDGWMWWSNLSLIDKDNIWIVEYVEEYGEDSVLIYTTDGGKTWTEKEFKESYLGRLIFLDKNRGIILTGIGQMLITRDGGKTWDKQRMPIRSYPWHCSEIFNKAKVSK